MLNKIILGDCTEVLSKYPKEFCDLVVTSPPYDSLRDYGGHVFDVARVAKALFLALKDGGIVVWVVADSVKNGGESLSSFKHAIEFSTQGFLLHDTMIFEKNTASFPARRTSNRYTQIFEYMFVFSKGKPRIATLICDKENKWAGWTNWGTQTKRQRDGRLVEVPDLKPVPKTSPRNNIWKYTVSGGFGQKDKRAYQHPATFPEELVSDHIKTWTRPGDVVLDPMCGSGTTCVSAKKNKRAYLGIEIHKPYFTLARRRLLY